MKKFYIGQRDNPQFKKPYYVAYGQITKKTAKAAENAIYGSMFLRPYETREAYSAELARLQADGFSVMER